MMNQTSALKYILLASSFLVINSNSVTAQITPDNTLGAESSRVVPNGAIDKIDGGALRDKNLFHSFKEFNINNGQSVYFSNPSGIENILTRVTGKNASNILGTLGVDGAANLFLINPNGILFGENARLDLGGSFVGTTANGLQFGEQGNFSATNPEAPGLLTVNPNALFFNQINQNAEIRNNSIAPAGIDASGFDVFGLRVPDGKSLLLVGGNVSMDGGGIFAFGGKAELGGLAEAGSIELQQEDNIFNLIFPSQLQRADVFLKSGADINAVSTGGGSVFVNARNLDISEGSTIATGVVSGGANSKAGNIEINATESVKIDGTSSTTVAGTNIVNFVLGSGSAGDITINTGSLDLTSNAQIGSASNGEGDAGNVTIRAKDRVSLSGINSGIISILAFLGVGDGANIEIQAAKVLLDNSAQISTGTLGKGNSGNIKIDVDDSLSVNGGSIVQASSFGQGNAGEVSIEAGNTVSFDGIGSNNISSGVFTLVRPFTTPEIESTGDRLGGDIKITTKSLSLTNGAQLNANTNGQGNAGNIFVRANDAISLSNSSNIFSNIEAGAVGNGGAIDINAKSLSLINGSQIQTIIRGGSETITGGKGEAGNININVDGELALFGIDNNNFASGIFSNVNLGAEGNGGGINITAGEISMNDSANIQSSTFGKGNAGNIQIQTSDFMTGNLILQNDALIAAETFSPDGKGGNINIQVGKLIGSNGGQVSTGSGRQLQEGNFGRGGNLFITAIESIELDGVGNANRTGFFSETSSPNRGGDLTVNTKKLLVQNGAGISSGASGSGSLGGDGGNLVINATESINLIGRSPNFNSAFATEANGLGNAGDITIATSRLNIKDGAIISALVTSGENTTNQVTIGNGGNIDIAVDSLEVANGGQIIAATFGQGSAGNITISAQDNISFDGSNGTLKSSASSRVAESGIGNGGDIHINTRELSVSNEAELVASVSNGGQGEAGNIQINADKRVNLNNRAKLFAESAFGNGGNIDLQLGELLLLRNNSQISTTAGNQQFGGDGGNIAINSPFIVAVLKENSDITANAFTGSGGKVDIITQGIFGIQPRSQASDFTSDITASSETGIQGEISVTDPEIDPSQGLIELPSGVVDKSDQIAQNCPRGINAKKLSEFYITGRGSLPPSPLNPLEGTVELSQLATLDEEMGRLADEETGKLEDVKRKEIVEAQGFLKAENGEVYLVAQAPTATPSSHANPSACPSYQ